MNLWLALPFHPGDAQLMLKNLRWQRELCGQKPTTAVVSHDATCARRWLDPILEAASSAFAKVLRYQYPYTPQNTWPQGPNWAFQHTAEHMEQYGKPWLWLEADAIPLKRDWLEQLEAEYMRTGARFLGTIVPELGHLNGVACYPSNAPRLLPRAAMDAVDNAWDSEMIQSKMQFCIHTDLIDHTWGVVKGKIHHRDGEPPNFRDPKIIAQLDKNAVLCHRDKSGSLIDYMRQEIQKARSIPLRFCGENMPSPSMEIFIISYSADIQYLEWNLKSIQRFAHGFAGTTLLVPTHERELFSSMAVRYSVKLKTYDVPENKNLWHLAHQAEKVRADKWCPDADMIAFTDSDCIFVEDVWPNTYLMNGKPVLVIEEYSRLQNVPWQSTVEAALKAPAKYLTMCRHPSVHYPGVLQDTRAIIEKAHRMPFDKYIVSGDGRFPWKFSEFSTLGTVALMPKWKDKYHFIDLAREPRPKDYLLQMWSHGPIDQPQDLPSVGGKCVPIEIIQKVLC